jgi:hypothetical protein
MDNMFNPINYSKTDFFTNSPGNHDIYTMQINCRDNFGYES